MNNITIKRPPISVNSKDDFELLPEDEIITLLCISRRTIRNWRRERKLPYYKIGHSILYDRSTLISFISGYERSARR